MGELESTKNPQDLDEWEKHHQAEKTRSIEEREEDQTRKLRDIVKAAQFHFEPVFELVVRKSIGESMSDTEISQINEFPDGDEMVERLKGLEQVFGSIFYDTVSEITGEKIVLAKQKKVVEEVADQHLESDEASEHLKLPKGYSKWDLKQIKLHESQPDADKQILVSYWSMKGKTDTGEIILNPARALYYFRSSDKTAPTFALTESEGRRATREAKNYYFKVVEL